MHGVRKEQGYEYFLADLRLTASAIRPGAGMNKYLFFSLPITLPTKSVHVFLLLMVLILAGIGAVTAETLTIPIGDHLPLSGYAPGADAVYIFLTGPNLPPNGVKLDDISVPVVSGAPSTFVEVPAEGNGYWEYVWYTRTRGGTPDAGTYSIYVVTMPVGRRDLTSDESHATISVSLTRPTLTIVPGGITIRTEPQGAEVWIDGALRGSTPLDLPNVTGGDHSIEIRKEGYGPFAGNLTVTPGENITLERSLVPETIPATPSGMEPPSPTARIPFPVSAVLLGLGAAMVFFRSGR
jgi:hypothetical protein